MNDSPSIVWFRTDLRIADNPALTAAIARGKPVLGLFIQDTDGGRRLPGGASLWWLRESLPVLADALDRLGVPLLILKSDPGTLLPHLARRLGAGAVFWNRRYGGAERQLDSMLKDRLRAGGRIVETFNSLLLREPWQVRSQAGMPMKVFTPYWRASLALGPFDAPLPAPPPAGARMALPAHEAAISSADILRITTRPDWSTGLADTWQPGEAGARARLGDFIDSGLNGYAALRDRPDRESTSRLSPYLAAGNISPRQIIHALRFAAVAEDRLASDDIAKFEAEIGWREFSYHLLYENPDLHRTSYQPKFDRFVWRGEARHLALWQRGRTGYPIVDAGMRQLWQTGTMHNRVRMVAASFLIKHLHIDWRAGEAWFWDTLVDADPASNPASWQWVAGSGADAAPYYRIFNPVLQGERFDPDGAYVRRFVPELAGLADAYIHAPWRAQPAALARAGIRLGETYPAPIVDHNAARARAMDAWRALG